MTMKTTQDQRTEHTAIARATSLPISMKFSVEISKYLRYKNTNVAKRLLEEVLTFHRAIPFRTFNRDLGHKPGMAAGRYPIKAVHGFLDLIRSVEANAQHKGLNTAHLKIVKVLANKAPIPMTGGRHRGKAKRTHLEIAVREMVPSAKTKEGKEKIKERMKKSSMKPSTEVAQGSAGETA